MAHTSTSCWFTDVHAFLAWFDISFDCTHTKVKFSTGPHAKYTHWKQTVFYTPETLTISEGEQITGRLSCAPNARNPRDLHITIGWKGPHDTLETEVHYKMCVCFLLLLDSFVSPAPPGAGEVWLWLFLMMLAV